MKKFLDKLGTFLMVIVVSVLVWLYAEDANVKPYTNYAVSIEFQAPAEGDMRITPNGERVLISFSGSNGQFQQLQERIRDRVLNYQLRFDPDDPTPQVEVDMRQIIQDQLLQDLGINLTEVEPATVTVRGEVIETVSINIVLDTRGVSLAGSPVQRQTQVSFQVPYTTAQQLVNAVATARLTDDNLAQLTPGQDTALRVPITPPAAAGDARPNITHVDVVLRQADNLARYVVDRRPVLLSYPPSLNQRFIIEIAEQSRFVTNIELEGPRDQIEAIRQGRSNGLVWATVRLSNEEVETAIGGDGTIVKAVEVVAPSGVRQVSELPPITIRVQQRPETPG